MTKRLYKRDADRLLKIAQLLEEEALIYLQGGAVKTATGGISWDGNTEMHVRYIKILSAKTFLVGIARRAELGTDVTP